MIDPLVGIYFLACFIETFYFLMRENLVLFSILRLRVLSLSHTGCDYCCGDNQHSQTFTSFA